MKRPRPYIPLAVRLDVARRQLCASGMDGAKAAAKFSLGGPTPIKTRLDMALRILFGDNPFHLDHNPALILREFNSRIGRYTPDANDPAHLIYRTRHEHHIKTNVRGDGAQFSDTVLRKRERRRERQRNQGRPKTKWPKRKLVSRSSWPRSGK